MRAYRGFRWGRLGRILAAAAACLSLLALPGCLTDGSIPVGGGGGNGVLRGVVVHAGDPDLPYVGARVTVRKAGGPTYTARCDARGEFEFSNVPDGILEATFEGAEPAEALPVRVTVQASYSSFSTIAIALAPAHMGADDVSAIAVVPRDVTVAAGKTVTFHAVITGGTSERRVPTWIVEGGVGSITPRGVFTALRPGRGTVRALAGGVTDPVSVTVTDPGQ